MGNRLLRVQLTIVVLAAFLTLPWLFFQVRLQPPELARDATGLPIPPTCQIVGDAIEIRFLLDEDLPTDTAGLSARVTIDDGAPLERVQVLSVPSRRHAVNNPYNVKIGAQGGPLNKGGSIAGATVTVTLLKDGEDWTGFSARVPSRGQVMSLIGAPVPEGPEIP